MKWEAVDKKDDRLKRKIVVDSASPGRGKVVIAENIRTSEHAMMIAAAPQMLDVLKGILEHYKSVEGLGYDLMVITRVTGAIKAAESCKGLMDYERMGK